MRTARRVVLLAAALGCAWAAGPAAGAPAADPRPAQAIPADLFPSGCEPEQVRERLASATDADVSRACGNISHPWAYRGRAGRRLNLRDFGRRRAGHEWTESVIALLLDAPVDTAYRVPGVISDCSPTTGLPIYLVRFEGPGRPTFAVLRFDLGVAQLFDAEQPLGMIPLGPHADSLWSAVGRVLDDDPLLLRPRPAVAPGDPASRLRGDDPWGGGRPDVLPEVLEQVGPVYPDEAKRTHTQGTVWVQVRVGADGAVRDAFVLAGPPTLRDASLDALWRWRFKPAAIGGVATAVWVTIPVRFSVR